MGDGPSGEQFGNQSAFDENAEVRRQVARDNATRRAEVEASFTRDLADLNKQVSSIESQRSGLQNQLPDIELELLRAESDLRRSERLTNQLTAQAAVSGPINFDFDVTGKQSAVESAKTRRDDLRSQIEALGGQARELISNQEVSSGDFADLRPNELRGEGSDAATGGRSLNLLGVDLDLGRNNDFIEGFRSNQARFEERELGLQSSLTDRLAGTQAGLLTSLNKRLEFDPFPVDTPADTLAPGAQAETVTTLKTGAVDEALGTPSTNILPLAAGVQPTDPASEEAKKILQQQSNTLLLNKPIANQSNILSSTPIKLGGN